MMNIKTVFLVGRHNWVRSILYLCCSRINYILTLSLSVGGDWCTLAAPYTLLSGVGAGATLSATRGDARMPHGSNATLPATPSTDRGPATNSGTSEKQKTYYHYVSLRSPLTSLDIHSSYFLIVFFILIDLNFVETRGRALWLQQFEQYDKLEAQNVGRCSVNLINIIIYVVWCDFGTLPARKSVAIRETMVPTPSTVTTHWYCPAREADMLSITSEPFGNCFLTMHTSYYN